MELLKEVANRYKVLATLGEGGMGTVYLVEDATTGAQVALKVLSAKGTPADKKDFLLFKQEFRAMARLRHPGTCAVHDYGQLSDGTPYFTMEVVPGRGLDELIPLAPDALLPILKQLGEALGYIHQQGLVHCDIKPENVRVTPDGAVKLMDFGLMEVAGQSGGAIKGTLAYMAPEVAKRARIDQRSDIYSLGAVTYQLLTGEAPFKGDSPVAVLRAHLNTEPRAMAELKPGIPANLELAVRRMLEKEPASRYTSVFDLLTGLGIEVADGDGGGLLMAAFSGRASEWGRLQAAAQALKASKAAALIGLTGAAGTGKSRLLEEFRFHVQLEEIPFLQGVCTAQKAPYGPFVAVLRALLPLAQSTCPELVTAHAPVLARLLPELAGSAPAPALEPDQERILIQAAIARLILAASKETGAVLALEDWDRADALSIETLTYLLRAAEGAPLVVVLTARETTGLPKGAEPLPLPPLAPGEIGAMAASMLGVDALPADFLAQVRSFTGGNPAFVTHFMEHLLRAGVLKKVKGRWTIPDALPPEAVPTGLQDLLLERMEGLDPAALRLAALLAAHGAPADLALLSELSSSDEEALFGALDDLLARQILSAEDGSYRFASTDLQTAFYRKLEASEREELHTALAEYLERSLAGAEPDIAQATALARHFLRSRHAEKAVRIAYDAARRNQEILANEAATPLLEDGLALLDTLPGEGETWTPLRCDYLTALAAAHVYRHNLDAAEPLLHRALGLAKRLGDMPRTLAALAAQGHQRMSAGSSEKLKEAVGVLERAIALASELGDVKQRLRCAANLGRSLFFSGQNARALAVYEENAEKARTADSPYWLARSLCFLGYLRVTAGADTRQQGFADLAEAVRIQERIEDKYGLGYTLMLLSDVELHAGRFKQAEDTCRRHATIMQELGSMDDHTIATLNLAIVYLETGQFALAIETAERCHEEALTHQHKVALTISGAVLATARLLTGDLKGASALMAESEEKSRAVSPYVFSEVIPYVIQARLFLGQLQGALGAAQEARDLVAETGNTGIEARLWVFLGELHGRLGEHPAARAYFEKALARATEAEEAHTRARAEKGLGWLELVEGKHAPAKAHLTTALELAASLPLGHTEAECHYLLGQLALDEGDRAGATSRFATAIAMAESLGAPALLAVALHGQSRAGDSAQPLLSRARTAQQVLLDQLDEDDQASFLSYMERAQLSREEAAPAAPENTLPALPSAPQGNPEERASWLRQEVDALAQTQAEQAARMGRLATELASLGGPQALAGGGEPSARVAELEASNRRMEQLIKFSMAVSHVNDLGKVLEQAVDLIVEITGAERGFLLFFEDGQIRSQVSRVNVDRRGPMDWQFSKSIVDKVLKTGEVVCVFDALADTQFNQAQSVVDLNLRTVICVPMRIKGRMMGAIYVDRQSISENFTESDLELVMSLAAQASAAIDNARVHQEFVEKSRRLEMLNHLSKTISSSLELEEVLDTIVKMTLEVSSAERGFLFLLDDDRKKLICRAARDAKGSLPLDMDHEISQSICAKVLTTGEATNVADAMNDEEFQFNQSIAALNLRMVMCVPIAVKGRTIGLIYVDSQAVVNAFGDRDLDLLKAIAGHASVSIENAKLHHHTLRLAEDLKKTFDSFVTALGTSIDAKHPLTAGHSFRVTGYSVRLARRIGMTEEEVENIRIAGLLHDVGKIGTPDAILMKPGSFSNEEYAIMKQHVVHTREILDKIYFPEAQRDIPAVAGAHHEKWDGTGYPNRQAGTEIPLGGRIMALGDVFDAITSKRDYREAMPLEKALDIIRQGIGTHFDPELAPVFIKMIEEEGLLGDEAEVLTIPALETQEV